MKRFISTALTGAILFAGGCDQIPHDERYEEKDVATASVEVSPERQQRLHAIYQQLQEYWGDTLKATLFIVDGEDEVLCEQKDNTRYMVTAKMLPMYCKASGSIALTGFFLNIANPEWSEHNPAYENAGEVIAIVHEAGHGVQAETVGLSNGEDPAIVMAEELQADCSAGRYIGTSGHYSLEFLRIATEYMLKMPSAGVHGPREMRRDAFAAGAAGQPC